MQCNNLNYPLVVYIYKANPNSDFVEANTLAKWKNWSQMNLHLAKKVYQEIVFNCFKYGIFLKSEEQSHFGKSKS